jgi:phosphonate dehydrogenase
MAPRRPLTLATHPLQAETMALLRRSCEVDVCEQPPSPETLAARAAGASALFAFMPDRVDARLLDACPGLQIVAGAFKGRTTSMWRPAPRAVCG